jgi:hypothetical protein
VIDFLYHPTKGNCVAWILDGEVFADSDRKIATTDRDGNIYALDGALIGHLEAAGVVPKEGTGLPDAFTKLLKEAGSEAG